jgi:HAMP domain-containing protein
MLKHTSIALKFAGLFAVVLALLGGSYYLMLRNIYYNQLRSEARTMSDNVNALGSWVAKYGRIWVKDNNESYLGQMNVIPVTAADAVPPVEQAPAPVNFYSKNPALAQREFSEIIAKSSAAVKFRLTSDNYMNPANKPDAFELAAIKQVKSQGLKEYDSIQPGVYRYVRTLYHQESCIACHGNAASAPKDVITRYGTANGFGFKTGDVAGVISVTVPTKTFLASSLAVFGPLEALLVIIGLVISFLFMRFTVIKPVKELTNSANKISVGQKANLGTQEISPKSGNEIHQLALALDRMRNSMYIAIQRMKATVKPTDSKPPEE